MAKMESQLIYGCSSPLSGYTYTICRCPSFLVGAINRQTKQLFTMEGYSRRTEQNVL